MSSSPSASDRTRARHQVRLLPGPRTVTARDGETVLDAALAAGVNLPHSCKSGHCGSCRARLLEGAVSAPAVRPLGISEREAAEGYVLLCQVRAQSDLAVEARTVESAAAAVVKTLPCRIARLTPLAPDVLKVMLRLPAVERLEFEPGQYLDVLLEGGGRRSFSIASPPHDSELIELHVRHVPGGRFTGGLFQAAREGALLRIEGPFGQLVYRERREPALLIAGGTGFAPVKAMLRHVLERGSQRRLHLYWGARTAVDLYEEERVLEWAAAHSQLSYRAVLSQAPAPTRAHHRLGFVHECVLAEHATLEPFDVYVAGPPELVSAVQGEFPRRGMRLERLHFDSFDYAPPGRS